MEMNSWFMHFRCTLCLLNWEVSLSHLHNGLLFTFEGKFCSSVMSGLKKTTLNSAHCCQTPHLCLTYVTHTHTHTHTHTRTHNAYCCGSHALGSNRFLAWLCPEPLLYFVQSSPLNSTGSLHGKTD